MINLIIRRLTTALSTFPTITNLLELILPLTGLTILLLFIGFQSEFLKLHILEKSWQEIVKIIVFSFFIPGLSEEIVFRVLFLPHPTENPSLKTQIIWIIITLVAFIIYHPFQGLTWNPGGYEVFINPNFLILAALLGVICTIAYLISGSI
ncbi:abortive infection protein [Nostoc commune NIES-4072]|uniref:Abortive infection protein n=1 Tax=Nostoc commune NIES-4072 TaxID=2005467 RepID=A0A2R5FR60_NOSCO|nr:CPBP family glutamic-type intramembrane protease [Nostoc commune]BBD68221.1 abortive infection protein [Nostoc commune HK-02]GBG20785.1 abortive infection protein [Nostoc commune NIES-4072]